MKLIFDQNLSFRLVKMVDELFPNSIHVGRIGLDTEFDNSIWQYAKENQYSIVTKDDDFRDLAFVRGYPPKVIWIRSGNCRVIDIEKSIRKNSVAIIEFLKNGSDAVMEIF
jgi:predicted nuclease of predicted toxin-antitoxin system